MSWSLLLAKHPRSILTNENALLVLALLERSGLTTEEDLSTRVNLELPILKKTLLDLQMNGLVEYGSQHVRLTERGKYLIDRFKLQSAILDDVLDMLTLQGKEREDYKFLLNVYRDSAFRFYQNSLCSIRVWSDLAKRVPSKEDPKKVTAETLAYMQTLLLRDLRNWWQQAHPPKGTLDKVDDELRSILTANYLLEDPPVGEPRIDIYFFPRKLKALREKESGEERGQPSSHEAHKMRLFLMFNDFQATSEPDKWFDNWCEAEPTFPNEKRFKNPDNYITKVIRLLKTWVGAEHPEGEKGLPALLSERWSINRAKNDRAGELIDMLLFCSNLDEISNMTGLSKDSVRTLLTEISDKCRTLLEQDRDENSPEVKDKSTGGAVE